MDITKTLSVIGPLSVIVPTIIGLAKIKSFGTGLKLLILYLLIAAIKEPVCLYFSYNKIPNLHIYNWTGTFDYALLIGIYFFSFKSKTYRYLALTLSLTYILFALINILLIQGENIFNSYTSTLGNVLITFVVLLFFYELLQKPDVINLSKTTLFWVSAGLLLYSIGTFFLHGLYALHTSLPKELGKSIWQINSVLYLSQNILFTIAFFVKPRN